MHRNVQNFTKVSKELADAKDNLRKVRDAHAKAAESEQIAGRIPKERRTAEQDTKLLQAEAWTNKMKKMLDTADLRVRTLEVQMNFVTRSAKSMTSQNGKSIRP